MLGNLHWVEGHEVDRGIRRSNGRNSQVLRSPSERQQKRSSSPQRSLTTPTSCPYCGAGVFFFRAEDGGCAFFDFLGSPWPKHPCFLAQEHQPVSSYPEQPRWKLLAFLKGAQHDEAAIRLLACIPHASGWTLIIAELISRGILLQFLGAPSNEWTVIEGKLCTMSVEHRGAEITISNPAADMIAVGPCYDCWNPDVWLSREGDPRSLVSLARDLGINRWKKLAGTSHMIVLAPAWSAALKLYTPAIDGGDDEVMNELVDLVELPARGVLKTHVEREIIRLRRVWKISGDTAERDRIYDHILNLLPT